MQDAVTFYDPERGFGFVNPDEGDRDVLVHYSVLARAAGTTCRPVAACGPQAEEAQRRLQATDIEPL